MPHLHIKAGKSTVASFVFKLNDNRVERASLPFEFQVQGQSQGLVDRENESSVAASAARLQN
jgi:hypothetical protein